MDLQDRLLVKDHEKCYFHQGTRIGHFYLLLAFIGSFYSSDIINKRQEKNQDLSIDNISTDTVPILIHIDTILPVFIKHRPHISHSTLFNRFFCISMTFDIFPRGVALFFFSLDGATKQYPTYKS